MSRNISNDEQRQQALRRGLELLSDARYWEAHEAWESLWLSLPAASSARRAAKTLIQFAALCYKPEQAASGRSQSDMQRGMSKLLMSARHHLAASFELPPPDPRWSRHHLDEQLDALSEVLHDWRGGQPLAKVRRRVLLIASSLADSWNDGAG